MAGSKMQGSCRCQAWPATTRHLAVKKIPRPLILLILFVYYQFIRVTVNVKNAARPEDKTRYFECQAIQIDTMKDAFNRKDGVAMGGNLFLIQAPNQALFPLFEKTMILKNLHLLVRDKRIIESAGKYRKI
ncbi:MAG: hypothetical protein PVI06_19555 [Desulfobacterales bacterium]|jgi:hypothetical protein